MSKFFDGELKVIPRSAIDTGTRIREDLGNIDGLAADITENGLINPITVRDLNNGQYELACGGRRITALDKLGWLEIPVRIYPKDTDDLTFRIIELKENIERKDLAWHEVVAAKKQIHDLYVAKYGEKTSRFDEAGHSLRDTAKMLGESVGSISQDIELAKKLELVPTLKNAENKSKAVQTINQAMRRVTTAAQLSKLLQEQAGRPEEEQKTKLVSSYVVGDFFAGAAKLPVEFADFIDLDPPYGINFDTPGSLRTNALRADFKEVESSDYPTMLKNVLRECYRIMKPNSWLVLWHASDPWAESTYQAILEAGFSCSRYVGIWKKGIQKGFAPDLHGRLSQSYEPFYYARKGAPGFTQQGRNAIFDFEPVVAGDKTHPTEKPISLMEEILRTFTVPGARVVVPFAGSGNTLLAANNYNCIGLGFDLSQSYRDEFARKALSGTFGEYK